MSASLTVEVVTPARQAEFVVYADAQSLYNSRIVLFCYVTKSERLREFVGALAAQCTNTRPHPVGILL